LAGILLSLHALPSAPAIDFSLLRQNCTLPIKKFVLAMLKIRPFRCSLGPILWKRRRGKLTVGQGVTGQARGARRGKPGAVGQTRGEVRCGRRGVVRRKKNEEKKEKKAYLWAPYLDAILQFVFTGSDLQALAYKHVYIYVLLRFCFFSYC
jgi:hypothetical protein